MDIGDVERIGQDALEGDMQCHPTIG